MTSPGAPDPATPEATWEYYEGMLEGLRSLRREAAAGNAHLKQFAGLTSAEIDTALSELRDELDHQVTLALVASLEAAIRLDFLERASRRLKSDLNNQMRALHQAHGPRVALEDILDIWKSHTGKKAVVGDLKRLYHLRSWLAHGRYWHEKRSGMSPSPAEALAIGEAFLALPEFQQAA